MKKSKQPVLNKFKKAYSNQEEYVDSIDPLLKRNTGASTLVAQDTGSNIPLVLTSEATPVRQAPEYGGPRFDYIPSVLPTTKPRTDLPPMPAYQPLPYYSGDNSDDFHAEDVTPEMEDNFQYLVNKALSEQKPQSTSGSKFMYPGQIQSPISRNGYVTPQPTAIPRQSLTTGGTRYSDNSTRYDQFNQPSSSTAVPRQSRPDGSILFSDGSIRRPGDPGFPSFNTNVSSYTAPKDPAYETMLSKQAVDQLFPNADAQTKDFIRNQLEMQSPEQFNAMVSDWDKQTKQIEQIGSNSKPTNKVDWKSIGRKAADELMAEQGNTGTVDASMKSLTTKQPANLNQDNSYSFDNLDSNRNISAQKLIKAFHDEGITDPNTIAFALSTAFTESDLTPKDEIKAQYGIDPHNDYIASLQDQYEGGWNYHGRGYTQLTHKSNYKKYGDQLGVDLVNNPDLAKDPEIAAKIMAKYFKDNNIQDDVKNGDFYSARQKVNGNGNDKLNEITSNTDKFLAGLQKQNFDSKSVSDLNSGDMMATIDNRINPVRSSYAGETSMVPSSSLSSIKSSYNSDAQKATQPNIFSSVSQIPNNVIDSVKNVAANTANNIEQRKPTGDYGVGATELLKGDVLGAMTEQKNTAKKLSADTKIARQLGGNLVDKIGTKYGLPEIGASELLSGGNTANTKKNASLPLYNASKNVKAGNVFTALTNPIQAAADTATNFALSKAGEGVSGLKNAFQGVTSELSNVFKNKDLSKVKDKNKVGETSGSDTDLSTPSLVDANKVGAPNDNRDAFFKGGGADIYKSDLNPGVDSNYRGALDLGLFKSSFYEDPNKVANVFGSTSLAQPATDKYRNYIYSQFPINSGGDSPTIRKTASGRYDDGSEWHVDYDDVNPIYYENQYNQSVRNSVPSILSSDFKFVAPVKQQGNAKGSGTVTAQTGGKFASSNYTVPSHSYSTPTSSGFVPPTKYSAPVSTYSVPKSVGYSVPTRPVPTPSQQPNRAPAPQSKPAPAPVVYRPPAPQSRPTPAPTPYKAPQSTYKAPQPTYKAPQSTYKAPAPQSKPAPQSRPAPAKPTNVFSSVVKAISSLFRR